MLPYSTQYLSKIIPLSKIQFFYKSITKTIQICKKQFQKTIAKIDLTFQIINRK